MVEMVLVSLAGGWPAGLFYEIDLGTLSFAASAAVTASCND
jgi:hypothetical protein